MRACIVPIAILVLTIPAYAQYSGGTGEPNDPYRIATAEDLMLLGESTNDYDKHFILTDDIDLDPNLPGRKVFDRAVIAPDVNDAANSPGWFEFDGREFTGVFDGNGYTISHLTIEGVSYLGLFGQSGSGAEISNLGLEVVNVNGTGSFVGGLVGQNQGRIASSYSTGSVSGTYSGGLVGRNSGNITACYSNVTVSGTGGGGLVGGNYGNITACYSNVTVSVTGGGGGLVGGNFGNITMSYSTGTVSGEKEVGGLVGGNDYTGHITSSYSNASVDGVAWVGGLVGWTEGYIISCYSTGSVSGGEQVGGLIGFNDGSIMLTSSCWDMETSGQTTSSGGFGLTTIEMMDPEILGLNGVLTNDPNWILDPGRDYPRLAWERTPGQIIPEPVIYWLSGQGTEEEPYRIDTADQLILLGRASILWDKHFILTEDIDLDPSLPGRRVFSQAVIQFFSGVFEGNGHTISHLTISGGDKLGFFGVSGGIISNLGLEAVDINGVWRVGGLAGYNPGSIANCYSTGSVSGIECVGGFVGSNYGSVTMSYSTGSVSGESSVGGLVGYIDRGSITMSYSSSTVSGNIEIGGLVGDNYRYGNITACYSTGVITGNNEIGGLVGRNEGSITESYSTLIVTGNEDVGGLVGCNYGSITSTFWDVQTSGLTNICGFAAETSTGCDDSFGLTTAQMQDINTYLSEGWDFVGEIQDGTHEIWQMPEEGGYPVLAIFNGYTPPQLHGQGTIEDPYLITDAFELGAITYYSSSAHYRLADSIDLSGIRWGMAIIPMLQGVFDGNGHTISHLTIEGGGFLGLFGQIRYGAKIYNLGLETVDLNSIGDSVGGLVGQNWGTIISCYSTGTVSGNNYVGGLVGNNIGGGSITNCYSTSTVYGYYYVGGLLGRNQSGSVSQCYSTGWVSGDQYVGGLVGDTLGYRPITSSFWDTETSGRYTSDGGIGATTTEMQTATTFLNASWDFVGEIVNGPNDVWWIYEGRDYPRLWWENLYVDDNATGDPLENGRQEHPFDTIQEAINLANDECTILVNGGVYSEPIDFKGKAITVKSGPDMAVLETPGDYAVSFFSGEGPDSILQNFIIRNSAVGVYVSGSSPTIRNLTIVDNEYGVAAYTWAQPDISNCIFWNNSSLDLFQCEARYSCIEDGDPGEGNLSADPLFINANNSDYHLLSAGWCWSTQTNSWTYDYVTSLCIDAGDPNSSLGDELLSIPRDPDNEYGVNLLINMGAYGGTAQASMPPLGWTP